MEFATFDAVGTSNVIAFKHYFLQVSFFVVRFSIFNNGMKIGQDFFINVLCNTNLGVSMFFLIFSHVPHRDLGII